MPLIESTHWTPPDDHWLMPDYDVETFDTRLIQQYLLLMDQPATPPQVYQFLEALADELSERFLPAITKELEDNRAPEETEADVARNRQRLIFQFRQHQFATQLLAPALTKYPGQWAMLHPLLMAHRPFNRTAAADNAVMKSTILAAHQELGLPTDPATIDDRWKNLNEQVDLLVTQRKIHHFQQWMNRSSEYPVSEEAMRNLWKQEQMLVANQIIHEELTEPITAKHLAEEENSSRAADLL